MKRTAILFSAFMIAFMAGAQPAEDTKPDFSGTWNQGASRYGPRQSRDAHAGLGSGWGKQFTIIQTEDSLTLERIIFTQGDLQPPLRYVYSLKGSETRNTIMMGRGIQEQVSTTSWEGRKLVIKTIFTSQNPVDGKKISCEVTHTLTLLINESLPYWPFLIVETKRGGVLGGPSSTTRTVYSKN